MEAAGVGAEGRQATNKDTRHFVDTVWSATAATWVKPKAAPAINATMTVLDSMSLPVWKVLSQ